MYLSCVGWSYEPLVGLGMAVLLFLLLNHYQHGSAPFLSASVAALLAGVLSYAALLFVNPAPHTAAYLWALSIAAAVLGPVFEPGHAVWRVAVISADSLCLYVYACLWRSTIH